MNKLSLQIVISLSMLFCPFWMTEAAVAEEKQNQDIHLEEIIVTAERSEKELRTGDVDVEETPSDVVVIEREAFEGKMETVSDVIEKEAGIQVRQTGGLGSFSSVSLRGSSSDQVMVFMDGILLNDASGGGVDLSTISLGEVESIEVYKGSAPINFGASSIGGVINIKTRRAEKRFSANAGVGYGSFNTRSAKGFINHKPGKFDYLVSADALASDNDFEVLNDNGTPLNPDDDRVESRNNAQFGQFTLLGKAGYDFTHRSRLDFMTQWFSKDQGIPSWNNSAETETSLATDRSINTLKYTHDSLGDLPVNSSVQFNYSRKEELYDDSEGHIGLGYQKSAYQTDRYGGSLFGEWMASWHTVTSTLDLTREGYEAEDQLNDETTNSSSRDTVSLGLQDQLYMLEDSLLVVPALRYTYVKSDMTTQGESWGDPEQHSEDSQDYWTPQLGVRWAPRAWFTAKSNIGNYVRQPHFYELSGDRGLLIGNPDLEAEEGVNFDLGFTVSTQPHSKWLPHLGFNATYFQSDINNLIVIVYDSRGIGRAENVEGAEIKGIEAGLNADLGRYFRMVFNATYQDTNNLNPNPAFYGNQLPGRWRQKYLARLEARYWQLKLWTEYQLKGDMYYDTTNLLKAENQKILDAGLSWMWDPFLLSLSVKNIQDNRYEDFNGFPMPGRSFFTSLSYTY